MKVNNPLPATCKGCPAYSSEKNFVPDTMTSDAQLHVILLSPTYVATATGKPDVTDIQRGLRLSGVEEINVSHLIRCSIAPRTHSATLQKCARYCSQYSQYPDLPLVAVGKEVYRYFVPDEDIYTRRGFRTEVDV